MTSCQRHAWGWDDKAGSLAHVLFSQGCPGSFTCPQHRTLSTWHPLGLCVACDRQAAEFLLMKVVLKILGFHTWGSNPGHSVQNSTTRPLSYFSMLCVNHCFRGEKERSAHLKPPTNQKSHTCCSIGLQTFQQIRLHTGVCVRNQTWIQLLEAWCNTIMLGTGLLILISQI